MFHCCMCLPVKYSLLKFTNNMLSDFFIHYSGKDLEETAILIADVSSDASLAEMCKQAKVVLNCVGPVSASRICTDKLT